MFATASIVVIAGYDVALSSLGALAGVGLALYLAAVPETGPNAGTRPEKPASCASPKWGRRG
jgi:hypothetical protein